MSGILRAAQEIAELAMQADVHGKVRLSLTFDNPSDRERFKMECRRQIDPLNIQLAYSHTLDISDFNIAGVNIRII